MPVENEIETTEETSDLRSDLVAAMEQAEATPTQNDNETSAPPPDLPADEKPVEEAKDGRVRDESGRFAKSTEKVTPPPVAKEPAKVAVSVPEAPAKPAPEVYKPPASFKATAREEWGKVPPAVQQEVLRRERETAIALEQSAEARQGYQKFREVVAPFEPMLRAQGVEATVAVQNLLQTAAALATSPVAQRANIIAGLIKTYLPGRDSLEVLDSTLAGVIGGQPAQNMQAPQYQTDPRIDEIYNTIQQAKQMKAQTIEQQALEGVRGVQDQEFFEDVRFIMADLLEVAGNQDIALSPMEAYNRAVALHPEVSKVMEQRSAAKLAANPSGSMSRARAAASSVRGSPATAPTSAVQPDDLRSVLEAAFDRAGR